MSALAAIPAEIDAIPIKERRISKRIRQAIDLISRKGITQREAAKQVGLHESHLSRMLREPHTQVFIARSARQNIQLGVLRASNRVIELVDAESEHVSLDASKHVLAIEGIKPTADAQVSVNIDIKAGYVIDLTDQTAMRTVPQAVPRVIDASE
jgi:pantoate kinase